MQNCFKGVWPCALKQHIILGKRCPRESLQLEITQGCLQEISSRDKPLYKAVHAPLQTSFIGTDAKFTYPWTQSMTKCVTEMAYGMMCQLQLHGPKMGVAEPRINVFPIFFAWS